MTVTIPPTIEQEWTTEQMREHALAYTSTRHGYKGTYLAVHGISRFQMRRFVALTADGDVATGRGPRLTGSMTTDDAAEIRRLEATITDLTDRLATAEACATTAEHQRDTQAETDSASITELKEVIGALGKAIATMQEAGTRVDVAENNSPQPSTQP